MDEPKPVVIENISETHNKRAYAAAFNNNIPHTTGVELKITVVNNAVEEVPEVTK